MKRKILALSYIMVASASISMSGCSLLSVYRIDLPQGTALTQAQVTKIQLGMSVAQVRYILGSPAIVDDLSPKQWHYVYDFEPGTDGKKAGLSAVHKQQKLTIHFSEAGVVEKITGVQSIPAKQ